jgi:hypothetical protein
VKSSIDISLATASTLECPKNHHELILKLNGGADLIHENVNRKKKFHVVVYTMSHR